MPAVPTQLGTMQSAGMNSTSTEGHSCVPRNGDKHEYWGGAVLTPEPGFAGIEADLGDAAAVSARESLVPWVRASGNGPALH